MSEWFNARKAAQVAAFFCAKQGQSIPVLKLVKLIYLADRHFMEQCGLPITNDRHVSMPHGPVNSLTYELIGGGSEDDDWSDLVSDRAGNNVALARQLTEADTDELSDAEIAAMEAVWAKFGAMSKYQIRDWTHQNCPEWEDPNGSSAPIPHDRTLKYLGVANPDQFANRVIAYREFCATLNQLQDAGADSAW